MKRGGSSRGSWRAASGHRIPNPEPPTTVDITIFVKPFVNGFLVVEAGMISRELLSDALPSNLFPC
jgi:hypothetical protein